MRDGPAAPRALALDRMQRLFSRQADPGGWEPAQGSGWQANSIDWAGEGTGVWSKKVSQSSIRLADAVGILASASRTPDGSLGQVW